MRTLEKPAQRQSIGSGSIPIQEMASLEQVLAYRNEEVVKRIARELETTIEDAQGIFTDTLQFLYICAVQGRNQRLSPPRRIDEGWHEFILFTKDYAGFCRQYFGKFLHHTPMTEEKKKLNTKAERVNPTLEIAKRMFSDLSSNWSVKGASSVCDCEECCCT